MTVLHLDFETRSRCDLIARGLHAYSRDPSTQVLMLGYAIDGAAPHLWLPREGRPPAELREAMRDPAVTKLAWNAPFEMAIMRHVLKSPLAGPWRDVMVMAYYASLPGRLEDAGKAIGLSEDQQKLSDGKRLIRKFSVPHKPSKKFPGEWRDETTDPEDWERFCEYCLQDVSTERTIFHKLERFPVPEHEWRLWEIDLEINERGLPVDLTFVREAARMTLLEKARLTKEFKQLTGLPNSTTAHLLPWLRERGYPFNDLRKATVKLALAEHPMSDDAKQALVLRGGLSKNSTSKFEALLDKVSEGRLHYSYQFGGASRSLRWAGRGVQPQNLTRPEKFMEGRLQEGTDLVRAGEYDELYMRFGPVLPVLSSLVRSSFRAPDGRVLAVADLNAIENCVIGWQAGCRATLSVFERGLCPYKSFGTQLFGVPYDQITKQQRTDSKPAVLGGGYRLGGGDILPNKNGDMVKTGLWGYAEAMGVKMTREQSHHVVRVFRETYPAIVNLWYDLEEAAYAAVTQKVTTRVGYVVFDYVPGAMRIRLPSGRYLHYLRPAYKAVTFKPKDREPYTRQVLFYDGTDSTPGGNKRWARLSTHGGKLTENCLAGDTEILTRRGWVPMVDVSTADCVWDGVEWVRHDGLVSNGFRKVISTSGVRMTPEHLVLTSGGWKRAESCSHDEATSAFERHFRLPIRNAYGDQIRRIGRTALVLARSLRLRKDDSDDGDRVEKRPPEVLRVFQAGAYRGGEQVSRDVGAFSVRRMGFDGRALHAAVSSSMAEIWRQGHSGLQALVDLFREFLDGYGRGVPPRPNTGTDRQLAWLHPHELSVGYACRTGAEYAGQPFDRYATRASARVEGGGNFGDRRNDALISSLGWGASRTDVRQAERYEQVYDLVNAGPRHRFTVRGSGGRPFLVHNCVQAISRDVLAVGLVRAKKAGFEIIGHAHDEIITEVDEGSALTHERLGQLMSQPIRWAPGLPLAAAGYTSKFYKKD